MRLLSTIDTLTRRLETCVFIDRDGLRIHLTLLSALLFAVARSAVLLVCGLLMS